MPQMCIHGKIGLRERWGFQLNSMRSIAYLMVNSQLKNFPESVDGILTSDGI
jgi:hypothetical protein